MRSLNDCVQGRGSRFQILHCLWSSSTLLGSRIWCTSVCFTSTWHLQHPCNQNTSKSKHSFEIGWPHTSSASTGWLLSVIMSHGSFHSSGLRFFSILLSWQCWCIICMLNQHRVQPAVLWWTSSVRLKLKKQLCPVALTLFVQPACHQK